MGMSVDCVSGYGIDLTIEDAKIIFKLTPEEIESLDDGAWSLCELSSKDYWVDVSGSYYSGELDYYLLLSDMDIVGLEVRCIGMKVHLTSLGIDKDPYWICETCVR